MDEAGFLQFSNGFGKGHFIDFGMLNQTSLGGWLMLLLEPQERSHDGELGLGNGKLTEYPRELPLPQGNEFPQQKSRAVVSLIVLER
jgi:hypothetical protein